jgi:hypothetical protein
MRTPPDVQLAPNPARTAPAQTQISRTEEKINSRGNRRKQASLEIIGEIEKSPSTRVRIGISSWRSEFKIEIREATSVTAGIYFPTSYGVTIPAEKIGELIEAVLTVERKLIERGRP